MRLLEAAASLSLAADLGFGQPLEDGLRVAHLATAIAEHAGLDADERRRTLYLALVRHIGCTANSDEIARVAVDEIVLRADSARLDLADRARLMPHILRHVATVAPVYRRPVALGRLLAGMDVVMASTLAACEAAVTLGRGWVCRRAP